MAKWESKKDWFGNRYDIFSVNGNCNCPSQCIMLCKDEQGFYFSYNIGAEVIYFQEKLKADTWELARYHTHIKTNQYVEKEYLKWKTMFWCLREDEN